VRGNSRLTLTGGIARYARSTPGYIPCTAPRCYYENVRTLIRLAVAVSVIAFAGFGLSQQIADPNFDAKVATPAYTTLHPKVLLDEAHYNFHTASGRYKPFADLITNDGYRVTPGTQKFTKDSLSSFDVLVISNALGATTMNSPGADNPAFTDPECDAVRDWVREGGRLLLIADHAPMGSANSNLAERFGVDMSKGYTSDPSNYDVDSNNQGFIRYDGVNKLLGEHAITRGRNTEEKISRILTFTGQSVKGPEGSVAFLKLADTAIDSIPVAQSNQRRNVSAAGRAQGIAFDFGKGRVVVLGEAAMMSAQLAGAQQSKFGMNMPGIDNRQLALNIMHWLSGLLN
jgi:hypothetical protein